MLIEMHCHSAEHSACSRVPAVELVRAIQAKGLQGLLLTDHHFLWQPADLAELRRQAGVPPEFLLLSGQETNVPILGDVLIIGAPVTIPRGTSLTDIRQDFPAAAIIWAHPYRDGRLPGDELLNSPQVNAIEIFNSNHTVGENSRGLQDWRRLRFIATSGTDTHAATYAGIYPTVFDDALTTVEELAQAIRSGHCRPYLKAVAHGEERRVTQVTIGQQKPDQSRETLIIRTPAAGTAWDRAERAFHMMAALYGKGFAGGTFRVPQAIEKNAQSGTILEEGISGESLFDKLISSPTEEAEKYLRLSAQWLARLHLLRLSMTTAEEFLAEERRRMDRDLLRFTREKHPYARKVTDIVSTVERGEQELYHQDQDHWVQGHGDFHPQNIIIGHEESAPGDGIFVAAIDFERTQVLPPAYDVGWFLAQARSQFASHPKLVGGFLEETFLNAYREAAGELLDGDFWRQVELFRARANVSIATYLVMLELGDAGELWRVLVESERALTYVV
ncbi:phosphotransferase [Geomonas sp.]|uniref:phosphotransferase n=1 Tax=Geomonas sp. TaxID=2651584 RepID=UPI002B49EE76|nr:phosphotransferase [Geomonas sp.]HJV33783.1 phosphotransferase [Geomonas sp.]